MLLLRARASCARSFFGALGENAIALTLALLLTTCTVSALENCKASRTASARPASVQNVSRQHRGWTWKGASSSVAEILSSSTASAARSPFSAGSMVALLIFSLFRFLRRLKCCFASVSLRTLPTRGQHEHPVQLSEQGRVSTERSWPWKADRAPFCSGAFAGRVACLLLKQCSPMSWAEAHLNSSTALPAPRQASREPCPENWRPATRSVVWRVRLPRECSTSLPLVLGPLSPPTTSKSSSWGSANPATTLVPSGLASKHHTYMPRLKPFRRCR